MSNRFQRSTYGAVHCPECGWNKVAVYDSRTTTGIKWRRRYCSECGHRWSTVEIHQSDYKRMQRVANAMATALDIMEEPS